MNKKKSMQLFIDLVFIIILTVLDQFTKNLAITHLQNQSDYILIKDVFELHYLENHGAAFGMFHNQNPIFIFALLAVLITVFMGYVLYKLPLSKRYFLLQALIILITAGAIGNMIDRILYGYVIDFFSFTLINFPIFNVADIYVTGATIAFIVSILFYYKEEDFEFLKRA